jgi:MFS family permease
LACVIGAFMFAGSENLALAKLSRFLIGFGSAFAFVGTMKLATIWLPPERFAAISGMITSLGMLGAMAGNIVLNYLVHLKGWRSMMFLSAWLGVALVVLIWLIVHDKVRTLREVDDIPYVPDIHFGHVCSGLWESLKNSAIWVNGLIGCFLYLSLSAFAELWGIRYLVQAYGLSHAQAVTANSLVFLGWAIGSPLAGWLSDILRRRRLPVTVGSLLGACVILVILYVPHIPLSMLYVLLFTFGVMCSVQVIVFAVGKEVSPRHIAGTAVSLTNMFVMASGVIFQPLIGWLLTLGWDGQIEQGVHVYSAHTYQLALSVLPVGLMLSVIFSLLLKETHAHSLRAKI